MMPGTKPNKRQDDVQPEMPFKTDLKEYAEGGKMTANIILIGSVAVNAMKPPLLAG